MKLFKITLFLLFLSFSVQAQIEIKGIVKDSTNAAVEFANVVLTNQKNEIVEGVVSDEKGNFQFIINEKGNYKLKVSFIGYQSFTKDILITDNTDLKVITLVQDNKLKEVVVNSSKPLIERKVDRLVFNVENLKKLIDRLDYKRSVSGGDHNASRMYLLKLDKLFSSDVIKTFKGEH